IVMRQWIGRSELHEPFVELQALRIAALESKVVAVGAEDVDIAGKAFEDAIVKIELEIELGLFGETCQQATCGCRFRPLMRVLARLSHGFPLQFPACACDSDPWPACLSHAPV